MRRENILRLLTKVMKDSDGVSVKSKGGKMFRPAGTGLIENRKLRRVALFFALDFHTFSIQYNLRFEF